MLKIAKITHLIKCHEPVEQYHALKFIFSISEKNKIFKQVIPSIFYAFLMLLQSIDYNLEVEPNKNAWTSIKEDLIEIANLYSKNSPEHGIKLLLQGSLLINKTTKGSKFEKERLSFFNEAIEIYKEENFNKNTKFELLINFIGVYHQNAFPLFENSFEIAATITELSTKLEGNNQYIAFLSCTHMFSYQSFVIIRIIIK